MTRKQPPDDDEDADPPIGEDDDADEKTGIAAVERLSSVQTWEMYRLVDQDTGRKIATIGLDMPGSGAMAVDYAVWRAEDVDEPRALGSVAHDGHKAAWDDRARESVLRQVMCLCEDDVGVESDKAEFLFAAPEGSVDGELAEDEG